MTDKAPLCSVCGEPLEERKDFAKVPTYEVIYNGSITVCGIPEGEDPWPKVEARLRNQDLDDFDEVMRRKDGFVIRALDGGELDLSTARHEGCLTKEERIELKAKNCQRLDGYLEV